jgi:hypothetical protein
MVIVLGANNISPILTYTPFGGFKKVVGPGQVAIRHRCRKL